MMIPYLSLVLMMIARVVKLLADTTPIPTCATLKKHVPIYWGDFDGGPVRYVQSFMTGTSLDNLFPKNWSWTTELNPSLISVNLDWKNRTNRQRIIVDLNSGITVTDVASSVLDHNNGKIVGLHHDDQTIAVFNNNEGRAVAISIATGDIVRNETNVDADRVKNTPSYSVIDGKYCVIGGNRTTEVSPLCYETSKRKWSVMKNIKIMRSGHTSIAHNGSLYVCGGLPAAFRDICSIFDIETDSSASQSQIDPPGKCSPKFINAAALQTICGQDTSMIRRESGNVEAPEKVTEPKLDVHLHADSIEEKGHVKKLRFLYHQNSVQFDIIPARGSTNQMTLMLNIDRYMPVIFGSELDRASEYVMDQITVDLKKESVLWGMLQSSGLAKWNFEIRIQYSCSKCSNKIYAVIVALVDVTKKSQKWNSFFKVKGGKAFLSPDSIMPVDREHYLFFETPVTPNMQHVLDGNKQTAWFVMNQRLDISEKDREMLAKVVRDANVD